MRKMKTMPKTVKFLGSTHKVKYERSDIFWGCSGTYHFVHKGYRIEIEYYGDEDDFDTVTAEIVHNGTEWWDTSLTRTARSLTKVLEMAGRKVTAHMKKVAA